MAIPAPANPVLSSSAPWTIVDDGSLLNINTVTRVTRDKNALKYHLLDGDTVNSSFVLPADADDAFQLVAQALGASAPSAPAITSITPNTATDGASVVAVIRGRSFDNSGTVNVGADTATVTFVDATTLLLAFTTNGVGLKDVAYTTASDVATLTEGFETT